MNRELTTDESEGITIETDGITVESVNLSQDISFSLCTFEFQGEY